MTTEYSDVNGIGARLTAVAGMLRAFPCRLDPASLQAGLPSWAWMWLLAGALFFTAKSITVSRFWRGESVSRWRIAAFCFLWPGMDARAFCRERFVGKTRAGEWIAAFAKTAFGAAALWVGVRFSTGMHPLITGWVGMVGIVFLLHFGAFHLLSLLWRALGIEAQPIMQSPGTARSVSRFWGRHWNTAFSDLMQENIFKPLTRQIGTRGALLVTFLFSGLVHELVISVPARGGYGLPTGYFILQGCAVLFERSKPGRRFGLGSRSTGWCFVTLIAGAPACWLLHPVFVRNVVLPMLRAIGAN